jgi:ABC-type lipoprotein release transport system permease subunit
MKANLSLTIAPLDPIASGVTIVLLTMAGGAACYLPARRASRVDPNVTLRDL